MSKVIELERVLKAERLEESIRFKVKQCPMLDGDAVYDAVFIVLEDLNTYRIIEICRYSEFLFQNSIINLEKNTRLALAKKIVMFLNSIHFDREFYDKKNTLKKVKNIRNIEDLSIKDGDDFLADYKYGKVGKPILKNSSSIKQMEIVLTRFYKFLYDRNDFKMKYLKKEHFKFKEDTDGRVQEKKKRMTLVSPFTIVYGDSNPMERLEMVSFYVLSQLIFIALEKCPMIALMIALQAFAGLRQGEVTNVSWHNISWKYVGENLRNFTIDLRIKSQLRDDGVDVGEIKSHEIAHVHHDFLYLFELIFEEHQRYIKQKYRKRNKFGAMFMNRNGKAMTDRNYNDRFKKLIDILRQRLIETGDPRAISEANILLVRDFTPHTLRYFFSQYIGSLPNINIFEIAMWRRDKSLDSAIRYIKGNPFLIDDIIMEKQNATMKRLGLY